MGKFRGGLAIIKAGGRSEVEMNEQRDRIEDAVFAVQAALSEGVVPGGGAALLYASQTPDFTAMLDSLEGDQQIGAELIRKCCEQPLRKIYSNANSQQDMGTVLEKLRDLGNPKAGYDARSHQIHLDMISQGIVDPVKVVKSSLRYGAGLASIMLTAECAIVDEEYDFVKRVHEQIRI